MSVHPSASWLQLAVALLVRIVWPTLWSRKVLGA
jgi:hypothetical protein